MDHVLQQLSIDYIFFTPYHPQSNGKLEVFHMYLKPTPKKLYEKDPANWNKYINQVLAGYIETPSLVTAKTPFSCLWQRSKPTTTSTSGTDAMILREYRFWTT